MGEETLGNRLAAPMQVFDCPPEIACVPIQDRGDDQVQPEAPYPWFSILRSANRPCR